MILYLSENRRPPGLNDVAYKYIRNQARNFEVRGNGALYKKSTSRYPWARFVPSRQGALSVIADAHELCGHGGIDRITDYVSKHFYIPHLYHLLK